METGPGRRLRRHRRLDGPARGGVRAALVSHLLDAGSLLRDDEGCIAPAVGELRGGGGVQVDTTRLDPCLLKGTVRLQTVKTRN